MIAGLQPGVSYQNTPQTAAISAVHGGNRAMYLNFVNGLPAGTLVYRKTISICPFLPTRLSAWMTTTYPQTQCNVRLEAVDANNVIMFSAPSILPPFNPNWVQFVSPAFTTSTSSITFSLYTNIAGSPNGNDLSFDDFLVQQCYSPDTIPVNYGDICSSAPTVNLFSALPGSPVAAGSWAGTSNLTGGYLGTFNPLINPGGTYYYAIAGSGCAPDTIYSVNINVVSTPSVTASQINVSCFGGSDGSANVNPSAGSYSYSWSTIPVQVTQTATGLSAGVYTVTVSTASGCDTVITFNISEPTALQVQTVSINATCYGGTGMAYIDTTLLGGTAPYSFLWSTIPLQTSASVTGLSAGTYSVTVTDFNGCSQSQAVTVGEPSPLAINISSMTPATCSQANGSITVNVAGGTPAYNFLWSTLPPQSTQTASSLAAGNYTVTVTDNYSCTATASFTVTNQPIVFNPTVAVTDVSCNGGNDGAATINISGSYSYSWNTVPVQTSQTAVGLISGNYTVTISAQGNCDTSLVVVIHEPSALVVQVTVTPASCLNSDGMASVTPSGGTLPYTFQWSQGFSTSLATGLQPGNYFVTVYDDNQCSINVTVYVDSISCIGEMTLYIPNVFTPDRDGVNEFFFASGTNIMNYQMRIFDRWGEQIFYADDITKAWDGTFRGNLCKEDVYVYQVKATDFEGRQKLFTGAVSLIR